MSDLLAAAAAALGTPEPLVKRAAEARANATGSSVDDILTAWAGGTPAPTTAPTSAPEPDTAVSITPDAATPSAPSPAPLTPTAPAAPVPTGPPPPYKPPVLVGAADKPMRFVVAAVGLFLVVTLVGFVGPSIQAENPGARTSEIPYSEPAQDGQALYGSLGCVSCHTQMVRPVVADVGLGGVTLNDTNQRLGTRRFGPDLADVGRRLTSSQIEAVIAGLGGHPEHSLSGGDMALVVTYLSESKTGEG